MGDSEKLAAAILKVLSQPMAAAEMGRNGRELVVRNYSWESIAKLLLERFRFDLTSKTL